MIKPGVGKDSISDFTTNLIKGYLCDCTETFAREHLADDRCDEFNVDRAYFNYETETWAAKTYWLPRLEDDYVLLTPMDILRREDTWINHGDMVVRFAVLPDTIPNEQLRARVNRYFREKLGKDPNAKQTREAAAATIRRFPNLIDRYVRLEEEDGDRAESIGSQEVGDTEQVLIEQVQVAINDLQEKTEFYDKPWSSYDECLDRLKYSGLHRGQRWIQGAQSQGPGFLSEVHLVFGLVWCNTEFDIDREPNNGRGPVDFKASYGAGDKSLIEFKLGSNRQLEAQPPEPDRDLQGRKPNTRCDQGDRLLHGPGRGEGPEDPQ